MQAFHVTICQKCLTAGRHSSSALGWWTTNETPRSTAMPPVPADVLTLETPNALPARPWSNISARLGGPPATRRRLSAEIPV